MAKKQLDTPVLFLVFNRPKTTKKVFEEIRKARPKKLYLASDGPREHNRNDEINNSDVRKIISKVDWPCEVKKLFRKKNLGCKKAVSSAIDWFFDNVKEGIILEDDCLPSQSFFVYCQELLKKYRKDKRVMQISGTNLWEDKIPNKGEDYFFSKYSMIWGWATWKRAWKHYNLKIPSWEKVKEKGVYKKFFKNKVANFYYKRIFERCFEGSITTWDYQWLYARLINKGLSINPKRNLISNIGFGESSIHTKGFDPRYSNLDRKDIHFPLKHPNKIIYKEKYEKIILKTKFNFLLFLKKKIKSFLRSL